jgi:hypothetical protein
VYAAPSLDDLLALPEDDAVSRVVSAIRGGMVTTHADGHLILPETLCWPIATNNVLFVRKCYKPLFEHVLNKCRPVDPSMQLEQQRRIVTGQPGIGKSVWS